MSNFSTYLPNIPTPLHFDMAVQEAVLDIQRRGVRVDEEVKLNFLKAAVEEEAEKIAMLNGLVGYEVNPRSPKQLKELLYDELKLPKRRKNKKITTNEAALRSLEARTLHEMEKSTGSVSLEWGTKALILRTLLDLRKVQKALSSYLNFEYDPDGKIRQNLSVGATSTGRFSSSKAIGGTGINFQTNPHEFRSMFIPDKGYEFAEFDLHRGESWFYGHIADDPELIRILVDGEDFHAITAADISTAFGAPVTLEEVLAGHKSDPKLFALRYLGKRINHASSYMVGSRTATEAINKDSDETGITVVESMVKEAQRLWKRRYFNIPVWWKRVEIQLNKDRTLHTPFGRRQTFYDFWGEGLLRSAVAYVPQSSSVDYLNIGMLKVYHRLDKEQVCGVQLLHQNHDSILTQYPKEFRNEIIPLIISELEMPVYVKGMITDAVHEIIVPVEASYGPSMGDLTEWKH